MIGSSVTRLRATRSRSPYAHGPDVADLEDWSKPETKVFHGCAVAPTSSLVKYTEIGSPIVTGISLLFPGQVNLDIKGRDRFQIKDEIWLIAGEPQEYVSPFTGYVGGTVVNLTKSENT